eukprot:250543_1
MVVEHISEKNKMIHTISIILLISTINAYTQLYCDQTIYGSISQRGGINYYSFTTNTIADSIVFDTCGSSFDTYLYWYDSNLNIIDDCDDCGDCGVQAVLSLSSISSGSYIL